MTPTNLQLGDSTALLRESEWLTRLARGLCGDAALAEDLAQEAMLAAWQARGGMRAALRPWLVGTVRRLVANRRRGDARRRRRELAREAAGTAPATDEVVERAELQHRVVQEVLALDEPYRTAILLRYYEDLSCREAAARLGVPVETVRTRVKRGVLQLRERLDARHGERAAWLVPLATSFGSTQSAGLGSAAAAVMVLLMNVKIFVVAAVLAVFAVWWWTSGATPPPSPAVVASYDVAPERVQGGGGSATATDAGDAALSAPNLRSAAPGAPARVTGRLSWRDGGDAVVGAEVLLLAAAEAQVDAHVEPAADVVLARADSDRDGRYELDLSEVVGPWQCLVRADGAVPELSQVVTMTPGLSRELAELRLCEAVLVRGEVHDTAGAALADVELLVSMVPVEAGTGDWLDADHSIGEAVTDAAGAFSLANALPAGECWVVFRDAAIEPVHGRFTVTKAAPFLDVRVHRSADVIRGLVVDTHDEPVAGLEVTVSGGGVQATTDDAGRFELHRRIGAPAAVELSIWRKRFRISEQLVERTPPIPWGTEDTRLVVPVGVDLQLQVVQAPEMKPVEVFDLELHRAGTQQWMPGGLPGGSGASGKRHERGVVELMGLLPGSYRALVVLPTRSVAAPLDIAPGETVTKLVLPPVLELDVLVVDADGAPVAGAHCDLIEPDLPLKPRWSVDLRPQHVGEQKGGDVMLPFAGGFLRSAGGVTRADGRLRLASSGVDGARLRVCAKGFAPQLRRVDPFAGALRVEMTAGATLRGRLEHVAFASDKAQAYVSLRRVDDPNVWFPVRTAWRESDGALLDAAARFTLDGVPPGDWQAWLGYRTMGRSGAMLFQLVPMPGILALRDGESRELVIDGAAAAPVRAAGVALLDGRAVPFAALELRTVASESHEAWGTAGADERGRFVVELPPGVYRVTARFLDPTTGRHVGGRSIGEVVVPVGPTAEVRVDLAR